MLGTPFVGLLAKLEAGPEKNNVAGTRECLDLDVLAQNKTTQLRVKPLRVHNIYIYICILFIIYVYILVNV